ncbi:MAG: 30S ribosomal protein S20 [Thermoflavifilum sp.]|nr:30S ribosomal protein S20 [Thermoflavifilum sp.]
MANHQATKKDVRKSLKRRLQNRYYGKTTRNAVRALKAITDPEQYREKLPTVISMVDKLAKRGVIHKNKASNLKSKLMKKAHQLSATTHHTS